MPKDTPYKARFNSPCANGCAGIKPGHYITWSRKKDPNSLDKPRAYHLDCNDPTTIPDHWRPAGRPGQPNQEQPTPSPDSPFPAHGPNLPFDPEVHKMEVPEQEYVPNVPHASPTPTPNGQDGLLDLIVSQVEAKVAANVRHKVDAGMELIDRKVQEKLDKINVPVIEVKRPDLPVVKIQHVHKQFKHVLELLVAGQNVYLHGAPGGHKSTLGPQLAEALGVRFDGISLSEQSPEYTVKGFTSPLDGKFYESRFLNFFEHGGLWQYSELDAANDNFRVSLNTALDNGWLSCDKGSIRRNKDFYLIADGNTCGRGAHPAFPSRTAFDAAFAARFFFVEFEYDWDLCKHIALGLNNQSAPIVSWAEKVSNWALANGVQLVMGPREAYKLAALHKTTTLPANVLLDGVLRGLDLPSKEKMLTQFPFPQIERA